MHINQVIAQIQQTDRDAIKTQSGLEVHPAAAKWPWRYRAYTEAHETALREAVLFASAALNREQPRWLTFLGPSGIGKTHLLAQTLEVCRKLIRVKIPGRPNENLFVSEVGSLKDETVKEYERYVVDVGWPRQLSVFHVIPALHLDNWMAARELGEFDVVFIEDIKAGDKGSQKVTRDRLLELLTLRSRKFTLLDANFEGPGDVSEFLDGRIASRLTRDLSKCVIFPPDTPDFSTLEHE